MMVTIVMPKRMKVNNGITTSSFDRRRSSSTSIRLVSLLVIVLCTATTTVMIGSCTPVIAFMSVATIVTTTASTTPGTIRTKQSGFFSTIGMSNNNKMKNEKMKQQQQQQVAVQVGQRQQHQLLKSTVGIENNEKIVVPSKVTISRSDAVRVTVITLIVTTLGTAILNTNLVIPAISKTITVVGTSIDSFWRAFPYVAAGLICGFKATAADIVAQRRQSTTSTSSTTSKIDWKRTAAFLLYGSMYQGMAQEHIYNHLYPIWFGTATNLRTVITKVAFDVSIQTFFFTLPFAYIAKACIYKMSLRKAMAQYIDDIRHQGLMKKYIALWAPVNMLTFSIVPVHYRVTWIAFVSFIWMIILSSITSRKRATE